MKKIAIIDYGMGNLDSVAHAVEECGCFPVITDKENDIGKADCIILPGVGSFTKAMHNLRDRGTDKLIRKEVLENGIPLLGICLGMQLLATRGSEGGMCDGLDLIPGEVNRLIPDKDNTKIPHVGWNEVNFDKSSLLFEGVPAGKDFYFVHSYHFICRDERDVLARTSYCGNFVSSVGRKNIFGVQFHPEKSLRIGLKVLNNFLSLSEHRHD
jgi:glutamine amidotransferase